MSGYVRRAAVRKMLEKAQLVSDGEYSGYCTEDVNINSIPTADVQPVVHGRWVLKERAHYFKCSLCKEPIPYKFGYDNSRRYYNYCPNCGAVMDGGSNNA